MKHYFVVRTALYCTILLAASVTIRLSAQVNESIGRQIHGPLCVESINFYNDSIAFYNIGCENHAHSISLIKWSKKGDTIICKAVENGDLIALTRVERRKGTHCQPTFIVYDLTGKLVYCNPVFYREEKDSTTVHYVQDKIYDDVCTYRKKHYNTAPLNLYPLYNEWLQLLPDSPFDTVIVHVALPDWLIREHEAISWSFPEFRFIKKSTHCYWDIDQKRYWSNDFSD